ncbi:MAG: hypothetical protein CM1200mP26_09860 [Acidimicrobiales bacterium]|nr:MAG: hypothetical protein CM1200mP26_09860 [Acidimicrobiales bacterium]
MRSSCGYSLFVAAADGLWRDSPGGPRAVSVGMVLPADPRRDDIGQGAAVGSTAAMMSPWTLPPDRNIPGPCAHHDHPQFAVPGVALHWCDEQAEIHRIVVGDYENNVFVCVADRPASRP